MWLLQPNPGEVVDRQSILHLKCAAGNAKKLNVQPFVDEINHLQDYLEKNWFRLAQQSIQPDYDTAFSQLKDVNARLWKLEDQIRELKRKFESPNSSANYQEELKGLIVQVALQIPELNDIRAELVRKINGFFGISTQEKIYG